MQTGKDVENEDVIESIGDCSIDSQIVNVSAGSLPEVADVASAGESELDISNNSVAAALDAPDSQDRDNPNMTNAEINIPIKIGLLYSTLSITGTLTNIAITGVKNYADTVSDMSGYSADTSRSGSLKSATYIPPKPGMRNRLSQSSGGTSSSDSSGPVPCNKPNGKRIKQLMQRWKNTDLLVNVLDYIDKMVFPLANNENDQIEEEEEEEEELLDESPPRKSPKRQCSPVDGSPNKRPRCTEDLIKERNVIVSFAKSADLKYHPITIIEQVDGQFKVEYSDKRHTAVIAKKQIVQLLLVKFIGKTVSAKIDTVGILPAVVSKVTVLDDIVYLWLLTNEGDFQVCISNVFLSRYQMGQIKNDTNGVNEESDSSASSSQPSCSGLRAVICSSGSDSYDEPPVQEPDYVTGCEPETLFVLFGGDKVRLKGARGHIPNAAVKDDDIVGPIVRGNWFNGLIFLLTASERKKTTPPPEEATTDSEEYVFSKVPFVHDRLELQIKLGGGRIVKSTSQLGNAKGRKTYLIAPRPCLTVKYIECLSLGIQPVCHEWVINCCKAQKLLPIQELPLGWSRTQARFVSAYERPKSRIFSGLTIQLSYGSNIAFFKFWGTIMARFGANVVLFRGDLTTSDVILVETGYVTEKLLDAKNYGMTLLDTEWVIESILLGAPADLTKYQS